MRPHAADELGEEAFDVGLLGGECVGFGDEGGVSGVWH